MKYNLALLWGHKSKSSLDLFQIFYSNTLLQSKTPSVMGISNVGNTLLQEYSTEVKEGHHRVFQSRHPDLIFYAVP